MSHGRKRKNGQFRALLNEWFTTTDRSISFGDWLELRRERARLDAGYGILKPR